MKRIEALAVCLLILGISILCLACTEKKPTDVTGEAKTVYYGSVEELTEKADLIIIGVKTDEYEPVIKYSNGYPYSGYTVSDFRITAIDDEHSFGYKVMN